MLCRSLPHLQTLDLSAMHDNHGRRLQPFAELLAADTWTRLQDLRVHSNEFDMLPYLCADSCSFALTHLSCHVRRRTTTSRQIIELLARHPLLQTAEITVCPAERFGFNLARDDDNDHAEDATIAALAAAMSSFQQAVSNTGSSCVIALTDKICAQRQARTLADAKNTDKSLDADDEKNKVVAGALCKLHLDVADDALFRRVSCPRLTTLTLGEPFVHLSTMDVVLGACPAVVQLTVLQVQMSRWTPSSTQTNVRTLRLSNSFLMLVPHLTAKDPQPATLTHMISAFPRLRHLTLPNWPYDLDAVVQCAESGALRELEELVVPALGSEPPVVTVDVVKRLLTACPLLRSFSASSLTDDDRATVNGWLGEQAARGVPFGMTVLCHSDS